MLWFNLFLGKRMKNAFFLFFLFISLSALGQGDSARKWVSIKAFLPSWKEAVVQLQVEGKLVREDTLQKDVYSFNTWQEGVKEAVLILKQKQRTLFVPLFLEPGVIKIRDEGKRLVPYGTPINDLYVSMTRQWDSMALLQQNLSFTEMKNYKRKQIQAFIRQNPSSPVNPRLLYESFYLDLAADDTIYYSLYQLLPSSLKASFTGKRIEGEVKQRYATAYGRQAPTMQLPDDSDQMRNLYMPGRYTLINFWASWCMPCKKDHAELKKLLPKYEGKGFSVVGVSLDTNPFLWRKAISLQRLYWPQVIDAKGWEGPVVQTYGVKVVPYNILLDTEGIIIAKNLSPYQLDTLLTKRLH